MRSVLMSAEIAVANARIILVHTSLLNQVEIYFSIIQRKVFTPNSFADLEAIRLRLALYQELPNQSPKPVQWTFDRTKPPTLLAQVKARHMALADAQVPYLEEAAQPVIVSPMEHLGFGPKSLHCG